MEKLSSEKFEWLGADVLRTSPDHEAAATDLLHQAVLDTNTDFAVFLTKAEEITPRHGGGAGRAGVHQLRLGQPEDEYRLPFG